MANKAAPYGAVVQGATLCYVTGENIICLKNFISNHINLYSLPAVIQGNRVEVIIIIIIISNLSNDRSKASCKTVPPHSAI